MIPRQPVRAHLTAFGWLLVGALTFGCDRMALLAPTEATLLLVASRTVLPPNSEATIIATLFEQAGTPVHNGTVITFTSTLGHMEPSEARTKDGKVIVRFIVGNESGEAQIRAFSGTATTADPLTIRVGANAVGAVRLRAEPATLPSTGGTTRIVASVLDSGGHPLPGVTVFFSTDAGSVAPGSATTDAAGEARTQLTTTQATTVTATVGAGDQAQTADIDVGILGLPTLTITPPTQAFEDQPATFQITAIPATGTVFSDVVFHFGDRQRVHLGALNGTISVQHVYANHGTYSVRLVATTVSGVETEVSTTVEVEEKGAIVVTLTASSNSVQTDTVVTFIATVGAFTGAIESYRWTFGDGSSATTTGGTITHFYGAAGVYTVIVRVSATEGQSGTAQTTIQVTPPPATYR